MADNYTLFSEVIPALTRKEQAWVRRVLGDGSDVAPSAAELSAAGIQLDSDDEDWPGFEWRIQEPSWKDLWIYSEASGSVENVARFVQAFLKRFRPDDCWHMTWAETCSRPQIGEFGGGGIFVTAEGAEFYSAHEWAAGQQAKFEQKARRTVQVRKS